MDRALGLERNQSGGGYKPRIADALLRSALQTTGAVHVVGPKWCGKTTTAERASRSAVYFQDPDNRGVYRQIAETKPSRLLNGEKPVLLDEWQDAPTMWDAVRFAVDRDGAPGQFILTGSSVPRDPDQQIRHSGAGRISWLRMRTMSLFESGESSGTASLGGILRQEDIDGAALDRLETVAEAVVRGGWPAAVARGETQPGLLAESYVESLLESDISRVDGIEKNPNRVRLLMRSLARNESTEAAMTTLRGDMAADDGSLSVNTIGVYLNSLRRLFVLDEQDAWAPAVRSKTAIRTSPVRRFCDPSIAAVLLRMSPAKLLSDFNTFGLLFESLCVRDLKAYAQANDADVFRYRDARNLECDAIVEARDGRWGAVEVKLGANRVEEACATLRSVREHVRSQHGGGPSFLLVITAEGMAYRRPDGIYVAPATCLGP